MARPSKLTPTKIDRIRALLADGASHRAIAADVGVSHETVRQLALKAKARRRKGKAPDPAPPPAGDVPDVEALTATPLPSVDDPEALRLARDRHGMLSEQLARLAPLVEQGDYATAPYVQLLNYLDKLVNLIHTLTPPAPKDPDQDVGVLEAEAVLLARLEGMIAKVS